MFIFSSLDDDGVVQATTGAAASYIAGQGYAGVNPIVSTSAVAATDSYLGGFKYSADGELRVSDTTAGLPLIYTYNKGIATTEDGQMCIYTDPFSASDAVYLNGVAVTNDGRVYMVIA
jgi:hypothetical protein